MRRVRDPFTVQVSVEDSFPIKKFRVLGRTGPPFAVFEPDVRRKLADLYRLDDDVIEALIAAAEIGFEARYYDEDKLVSAAKYL